jgi:hypothetical protein
VRALSWASSSIRLCELSWHLAHPEPEDLVCTAELLRRAFFQRVLAETVS